MLQRHRSFVDEYIITGNGAEAARRSGYAPASARQAAYRLLQKEEIQARLKTEKFQAKSSRIKAKSEATRMLMEAFRHAESSTEMRKAVDALCRLHGLF